jgi:FMN phosphatase YigB (HAD superfamily)
VNVQAVLFDYSGTLLRLEEDDSWFENITVDDEREVDGHVQAELMRRLTERVGDSDEADGGARAIGCGFALVDPLPTSQRTDGLRSALAEYGMRI